MQDEVVRLYKVPRNKISLISAGSATWLDEIIGVYKKVVEGETR
jgi:hypothetical protein